MASTPTQQWCNGPRDARRIARDAQRQLERPDREYTEQEKRNLQNTVDHFTRLGR